MYKNIKLMDILIADSSAKIVERLADIITFKINTAVVYTAYNFEKALLLFKENRPSAVLLGMNLPGNQSIELLRAMKKTGHHTSIIILSIYINNSLIKECKQLGATVFLDKFLEFEKIPEHLIALETDKKQVMITPT